MDLVPKVLLIFAGLALFIQLTALVSLQVVAAYVFGGTAIIFALLAMIVALYR